MAKIIGVIIAVIISLSSLPLVTIVTNDADLLSQPFAMMTIGFVLLAVIAFMIYFFLPPTKPEESYLEGRGALYYTCCVFMWASSADLTIQSRHVELFNLQTNTRYFHNGELYLATPFGITTQFWNAIVHYFLSLLIIFQIDNNKDCRCSALYWCGSFMTSQFVVLVGAFTGSYSDKLEYPVWLNIIFIGLPVFFFAKFVMKPIYHSKYKSTDILKPTKYIFFLCILLVISSNFCLLRGLGALGSNYPLIKYYIDNFEPYIKDPSYFGRTWILYAAVYGIPMQFVAIYGLLKPGCSWMLNLSVYYAAGMLQGTFTYLSYSWYPSSEPEYRIPKRAFPTVCLINVLFVIIAHMLLFRCITNQKFFVSNSYQPLKSINSKKIL